MRIAWVVLAVACGGKPEVRPFEVIAADQPHPHQVAVRGEHVYWSNYGKPSAPFISGSIVRRKREGGAIEVLQADLGHPQHFTMGPNAYYWTDRTKEIVARVPIAGGNLHVWTGQPRVEAIAVVGETVYWTVSPLGGDKDDALVKAVGTEPPQTVAPLSGDGMVTAMAVDGDAVYVARYAENNTSEILRIAGGKLSVFVGGLGMPIAIAVRDGRVLWTDCVEQKLVRSPAKPDGKPEVLALFPAKSCPSAIAFDNKDLYVSTSENGSVWLVRDEPHKISKSDLFAVGITLDATHVYWANNGTQGSVLRVKR